jgi:hypothetical protein
LRLGPLQISKPSCLRRVEKLSPGMRLEAFYLYGNRMLHDIMQTSGKLHGLLQSDIPDLNARIRIG